MAANEESQPIDMTYRRLDQMVSEILVLSPEERQEAALAIRKQFFPLALEGNRDPTQLMSILRPAFRTF